MNLSNRNVWAIFVLIIVLFAGSHAASASEINKATLGKRPSGRHRAEFPCSCSHDPG